MTRRRLKNVDNEEVKEKFLKEGRIKLRIIEIPLDKVNEDGEQEIEYLVTNLPKEIAPYEDFKDLYNQR